MTTALALNSLAARLQRSALYALLRKLIFCGLILNLVHDVVCSEIVPAWGHGHPTTICILHAALWGAALALAGWPCRPEEKRWDSIFFTSYAALVALGATVALYWAQITAFLQPVAAFIADPLAQAPQALPAVVVLVVALVVAAGSWDFYFAPKRRRQQYLVLSNAANVEAHSYQMQVVEQSQLSN